MTHMAQLFTQQIVFAEHFAKVQDNVGALPRETVIPITELPEKAKEVPSSKDNIPLFATDETHDTVTKDKSHELVSLNLATETESQCEETDSHHESSVSFVGPGQ